MTVATLVRVLLDRVPFARSVTWQGSHLLGKSPRSLYYTRMILPTDHAVALLNFRIEKDHQTFLPVLVQPLCVTRPEDDTFLPLPGRSWMRFTVLHTVRAHPETGVSLYLVHTDPDGF